MKANRRQFFEVATFTGLGSFYNGQPRTEDDNRLRIYNVDPRDILMMFYGPNEVIGIKVDKPELPKDAKVVGVNFAFDPRCFQLLVHSKEFDSVPLGERLPVVPGLCSFSVQCIARQPDGSYR